MDFSIFDEFDEEVVVIDKDYRIIYANRRYVKDLGFSSPEEVIGKFCFVVSHHRDKPCEGDCHPCPILEIEKHRRSVSVVHTHYTHDNKEFPVEITAFPIDGGEKVLQIIRGIKSDKEKYYLFSLTQKLSSVGFLALGLAHQISTPLGTILLALEELEEKIGDTEEIRMIKNAVNTCKDLVDKMLLFVKRSSNRDFVDLRRAVEDVIQLLKVYAKDRKVKIEAHLENVGFFLGNESDIRHLFLNLILNALQVSPEGETVTVRLYGKEDAWVLEVSDNGPGIDAEEMDKIFLPFYQGKNKREGSGLGLAIVSGIVKEYGGSIEVDSVRGKGTTFRIIIPFSEFSEFTENGSPATA